MRRFVFPLLLVALMGCRGAAPPAVAPVPAPVAAQAPSNDALLFATLWVQTAAEYRAAALQSFAGATRALDENLGSPSLTAAVEQTGDFGSLPPAVIVDIDETMLDNSPFEARLIEDGGPYTEERWAAWVDERAARAIPGAVDFARHAAARGVTIFYVSNRAGSAEEATRANLRSAGFPIEERFDAVLLKGERDWTASEKSPRRAHVAATHRILLLVGDDLGDFLPGVRTGAPAREALIEPYASWWGTRWFVIPNPMYGSWEGALSSGAKPEERLRALRKALRTQR
jgi:acid phosphatase